MTLLPIWGFLVCLAATTGCASKSAGATDSPDAAGPVVVPFDTTVDAGATDAGPIRATVLGAEATTWATYAPDGAVLEVAATFPVAAVVAAPMMAPAGPILTIAMPPAVAATTSIDHLEVTWKPVGHASAPYQSPHFDFHFFRPTMAQVLAIDCSNQASPPPSILPEGYISGGALDCVTQMGIHAQPLSDFSVVFAKTMIFGSYAARITFIEPMITKETLLARKSFSIPMLKPSSLGGAHTRFPTTFEARYLTTSDAYDLVFGAFVDID